MLLLPFVHGIDSAACSQALAFARETHADLLLLALLPAARKGGGKRVRPEMIAQAYDFFEYMKSKASRYGITVTCTHLLTRNITQSIQLIAQEMLCAGVLLFVRDGQGVFIETEEIKHLLADPQLSMYIIRLESQRVIITRQLVAFTTRLGELLKRSFFLLSHDAQKMPEEGCT